MSEEKTKLFIRRERIRRLKAIGVERVNRRMKVVSEEGIIWRRILNDAKAHDAQAKGRKPVYLTKKTTRKIRKVEA